MSYHEIFVSWRILRILSVNSPIYLVHPTAYLVFFDICWICRRICWHIGRKLCRITASKEKENFKQILHQAIWPAYHSRPKPPFLSFFYDRSCQTLQDLSPFDGKHNMNTGVEVTILITLHVPSLRIWTMQQCDPRYGGLMRWFSRTA